MYAATLARKLNKLKQKMFETILVTIKRMKYAEVEQCGSSNVRMPSKSKDDMPTITSFGNLVS